jgi:hypothetical protein
MIEAWFREPGNMVIALFAALFLMGIARLPRILTWFQRVQMTLGSPFQGVLTWTRAGQKPAPGTHQHQVPPPVPVVSPPPVLTGARRALLNPPGVALSLEYMRRMSPHDRYLLPLGWQTTGRPQPDLVHTALVGETNHVLISGASDSGKDNLAWWMLLSLALAHPESRELQVAIVDGKGLDFQPWQAKAQTWALATDPEEIPALLRALSAERQRRKAILSTAGVSKWDHYQGGDLPLLVVFISELSLLETALKRERSRRDRDRALDLELEHWLNTELTAGRAFGIRYLIGMQTVSGMDMLWRSQIGVFMSGYQPDESQVKPNTSKTPKQIAEKGAIPPNLLPAPPAGAGVFTIVSGEQCATARAPYLSDTERRRWLASLPERQLEPGPEVVPGDLLASLIADATMQPAAPTPGDDAPTRQEAADVSAGASALPFSAGEVAVIAARMARGETKTEVVRSMPGYATRRHREFVAS